MSELWTFALGSVLTFVAQWILQLHVVPRVELRKRREDRWERTVIEFGELLAGEVLIAGNAAVGTSLDAASLRTDDALSREDREGAAIAAMWEFRQLVDIRLRLMADRIVGLAPQAPALTDFARALSDYRGAVGTLALYTPRAEHRARARDFESDGSDSRYGKIRAEYMAVESAYGVLFNHVRQLSRSRPPNAPRLLRLRNKRVALLPRRRRNGNQPKRGPR